MATDFSNISNILAKLYMSYKEEDEFNDFIEYNDIGLPLAYLSSEGLSEPTDDGRRYITETWDLFLSALDIKDTGFTTLEEVFNKAGEK